MALSQNLQQKLLQKLSPQQIQLMKLLQVPTANLEERIKEEMEENPALEQEAENHDDQEEAKDEFTENGEENFEEPDGSETDYDNIEDRKSTRLNSSHSQISYAVFCLKKKKKKKINKQINIQKKKKKN